MSSFSEVQQATCQILKDDEISHSGTGFFILPRGYILTCHHVIFGLKKLLIRIPNDKTLHQAEYLKEFSNPVADFAVLKLCDVSIDALQLGRIREGCKVYGFGFRPNNIEPKGHTFLGDLGPGQELRLPISSYLRVQLEKIPLDLRQSWNILPEEFRVSNVRTFTCVGGLEQGISGGPVYDEQLRRVVGVFRAIEKKNFRAIEEKNNTFSHQIAYITSMDAQIAYIIPIDEIFAYWPDLEKENTKQVPDKEEDCLKRDFNIQPISEGGKPISPVSLRYFEPILSSRQIFGRNRELSLLDRFVNTEVNGYFFITGPAGFGKTTLLSNWATSPKIKNLFIVVHFITPKINAGLYFCLKSLCEQLMKIHGLGGNISQDTSELQILFSDLLNRSPPSNTSIVIILDGLDEAIGCPDLSRIIPSNLQKGIYFIVSMRDEIDEIKSLKKRLKCTNHITLPKLCHDDIVDWLQSSENDMLKSLSRDKTFTEELTRKTDGFPLYLHYLIDEINNSLIDEINNSLIDEINNSPIEKAYQVLERSPQDFSLYVHDQFSLLAKTGNIEDNRRFLELFALLSIAHSALSEADVKAMTEITEWDLQRLPWSLKRWFNIITTDTSRFYSFTHPLLAQEFKRELRNDSQNALKKMLDYCSNFQKHKSPYAFRHFTEHLLETKQYEKLFALVDNKIFWDLLFETFPEDLLQTVSKNFNAVLRAAIEIDDVEHIVHYLIFHAKLLAAIRDMSPSGALSKGNLQLAWELADLSEYDESILWYLFLSWKLKNSGKLEEANKTLTRLLQKYYPKTSHIIGWEEYVAALLVHVYDVSEEAFYQFQQDFFKDDDRLILCDYLSMSGYFTAAEKIVSYITDLADKVNALRLIGNAQIREGKVDDAISSLNFALDLSKGFEDLKKREEIQLLIKESQAKAYGFSSSIETVQSDSFYEEFEDKVLNNFNSEISAAKEIRNVDTKINRLVSIAEIQSINGEKKLSQKAFGIAIKYAQQIPESESQELRQFSESSSESSANVRLISAKAVKLSYIAKTQAKVDDFMSALETSYKIEDRVIRAEALAYIVKKQADNGDLTSAMKTSLKIENEMEKEFFEFTKMSTCGINHLQGIASLEDCGFFDLESSPIISILNSYLRALASIAINQAKCGKKELASDTFYKAVNLARRHLGGMWIIFLKPVIRAMVKVNVFAFDIESSYWIETKSLKDETLVKIVKSLAKQNDFRLAIDIVSSINDQNEEVRLLTLIAKDCTDKKNALLALEFAQIVVRMMKRKEYQAINLTIIAKAATRIEEIKLAKKMFKKALKIALRIDHKLWLLPSEFNDKQLNIHTLSVEASKAIQINSKRWNTLKAISKAQAEVGFYTDAIATANKIEYYLKKEEAMQSIAISQVKSGNVASAFETINKMADLNPKYHALNSILEEVSEPQDLKYAIKKAEQVEVERIDYLLGSLVKAYIKLGDLNSAIYTAMKIEQNWEKEQVLKYVAKAKAETGDFSSAFTIIQKFENNYNYNEALEFIAKAQAKANDFTSALETVQGISNEYQLHKYDALESIATAQAKVGDYISSKNTAKTIEDPLKQVKVLASISKEQISMGRDIEAKLTLDAALNLTIDICDDREKSEALVSIINVKADNNNRIVKIAETILTDRAENLSDIAEALILTGDFDNFKKLLISCSYYLESSFDMCRFLVKLYPDKLQVILKIIEESEILLSDFCFVTDLKSSKKLSMNNTRFSPKVALATIYETLCKKSA